MTVLSEPGSAAGRYNGKLAAAFQFSRVACDACMPGVPARPSAGPRPLHHLLASPDNPRHAAMQSGLPDHVWEIEQLVNMVD
jgi:hypothetical protein